jgi:hypothetical protein
MSARSRIVIAALTAAVGLAGGAGVAAASDSSGHHHHHGGSSSDDQSGSMGGFGSFSNFFAPDPDPGTAPNSTYEGGSGPDHRCSGDHTHAGDCNENYRRARNDEHHMEH